MVKIIWNASLHLICDKICQKLSHILPNGKEQFLSSINSFTNKIANYLITRTPLPNIDRSALTMACFLGLSDVHECSCVHWMPMFGLYRQPPHWKLPPYFRDHTFQLQTPRNEISIYILQMLSIMATALLYVLILSNISVFSNNSSHH